MITAIDGARVRDLKDLVDRLEAGEGDDLEIGIGVMNAVLTGVDYELPIMNPMAGIEECSQFIRAVLPGFWFSVGLCCLSGDASMGPDYNDPAHRERLLREWPQEHFDAGLHADLRPGDGLSRCCRALLSCMLQAIVKREELRVGAEA